jgi:hypothetical protein
MDIQRKKIAKLKGCNFFIQGGNSECKNNGRNAGKYEDLIRFTIQTRIRREVGLRVNPKRAERSCRAREGFQ